MSAAKVVEAARALLADVDRWGPTPRGLFGAYVLELRAAVEAHDAAQPAHAQGAVEAVENAIADALRSTDAVGLGIVRAAKAVCALYPRPTDAMLERAAREAWDAGHQACGTSTRKADIARAVAKVVPS
jgi:hypothetical protein